MHTGVVQQTAGAEPEATTEKAASAQAGFVDIHCHLLPGLDDGPKSDHESMLLARAAIRGGAAAIVATPHASFRYPFDASLVRSRLRELEGKLGDELFLFSGCELEISDEGLRAFFAEPARFTINQGRYVLVELRLETPTVRLPRVLERFLAAGVTPILAHPERYGFAHEHSDVLAEWVSGGGLMQVTGDSFSGRMGRRPRTTAFRLLDAGLFHFVASDAHDAVKRPPDLRAAWRTVSERLGEEAARRLFVYNPLRVLRDEPL